MQRMEKLAQATTGVPIGSTFGSPFGQGSSLGDFISLILRLSFVIAGILILLIFMFAGWNVLLGAGNNDPQAAAKGRQAATAAAVGFVVVFVAYWVIRLIEAVTGVQFITGPFNVG